MTAERRLVIFCWLLYFSRLRDPAHLDGLLDIRPHTLLLKVFQAEHYGLIQRFENSSQCYILGVITGTGFCFAGLDLHFMHGDLPAAGFAGDDQVGGISVCGYFLKDIPEGVAEHQAAGRIDVENTALEQ